MDEARDEENNNEANSSSWWGSWPSWLQTAKEKSSTALEFMKRDLTEFSHVVQTDAVAAVSSTAAILKGKLTVDNAEAVAGKARQSITSVLETITDVFAPPQKELEDSELIIIKNSEPVIMDWWQTQLYLIRKDPKTFCHEPEGPPEMYENWLESFDPNEYQDEMTEIMMTCSEVRAIYDKLVPTSVSHLEFWQRYFYRVHLLRKAESKRADLMRRAESISIEDIEWDKDCEILQNELSSARKISLTHDRNLVVQDQNISYSDLNQKQSTGINLTVSTESKGISTSGTTDVETVTNKIQADVPNISTNSAAKKTDNALSDDISNITPELVTDPSSADSTDGSRSSPIESLGKDSSTGDDWEKDFDLEINENDLKKLNISSQVNPLKEDEDDWEKWQ